MVRAALWLFDEVVPFGKWLRAALGAFWAWMGRNPLLAALLASLCVAGWLWHRGNGFAEQLRAMQAAQATAARDQATVNHEPARKSGEIARKSDVDAHFYYETGRRAGAAYADAHRVRGNACPTGGADLSRADRAEPGNDGPGDTADMVAVTRADFDILTGNSLRVAKVHQDAEALIAFGIAVADDGTGGADVPPPAK